MASLFWLGTALTGLLAAPADHYHNDFEAGPGPAFWLSRGEIDLHHAGLSDQDPHGGARCGLIDFTVTRDGWWYYFKLPLDQPFVEDATYILDAWLRVEAPAHVNVSLGLNRRRVLGAEDLQGNSPATEPVVERGRWVRLLSGELGRELRDENRIRGYCAATKTSLESVYFHIVGARRGERVRVAVDDLRLRPVNEEDRARWAAEEASLPKLPVPDYPDLERRFGWGCYGSPVLDPRLFPFPLEVSGTVIARDWLELGFDTCILGGGFLKVASPPERDDALGQVLDFCAEHGIAVQPSIYLTGYYEPDADRRVGEQAIARVVTRFRDHPAVMGWYILDEPRPERAVLQDHWYWGRQRIEAVDPRHPVTSCLNNPDSVRLYASRGALTQVDWYPLSRSQFPGAYPLLSVSEMCRTAWSAGARRLWYLPQAYADERKRRLPSAAEIRAQTWLALASGATGILYFAYHGRPVWHPWGGSWVISDVVLARPSAMGREVQRLGGIVPILGPALCATRWRADHAVTVEAPELPGFGRPILQVDLLHGPDYDVVAVCNLDVEQPRSGVVRLPAGLLANRRVTELVREQPVTVADGGVTVALAPGDAAFLLLADEVASRSVLAGMAARRAAWLRRLLAAELAEARAAGLDTAAVEDEPEVEAARRRLRDALARHQPHRDCATRLTALQELLSASSAEFDAVALTIAPEQRRAALEGRLKPQVEAMMAACRAYYLARYELLTGKLEACRARLTETEPQARRVAEEIARLAAPPG